MPKPAKQLIERKAIAGNRQRSALLYADNKIYVLTENGPWAILEPTEDGFEILNKGRVDDGLASVVHRSSPTDVCTSQAQRLCTVSPRTGRHKRGDHARIRWAMKHPSIKTRTATQLQIVPAESLVAPGGKVEAVHHRLQFDRTKGR